MYLVVILIISILLIVVLSSKMQIHPLLALIFACLFFGIFSGMPVGTIASSINDGFGQTLGKIGMIIVLGVIIGKFLEKSGGAFAMAEKIIQLMGKKNVTAAMSFIGYIVAIPVFADSGFIILTPLNRSLTKRAGLSFATTSIALALGLIAAHTMVPPTPGPLAAAGILNANLGLVLFIGMPVAFLAMLGALFYTVKFASGTYVDPAPELREEDISKMMKTAPGSLKSSLPIFVPILLIVLKSFLEFFGVDLSQSFVGQVIKFVGDPVIALIVGLLLAFLLPKKLLKDHLSTTGWVGESLQDAAIIILITGAGGSFGMILQNSGIAKTLSLLLSQWPIGLWLPFILASAIKTAQGSSTVAIMTTASILSPMMSDLGFDSEMGRAMFVVAIGAGSAVVSHLNDSLFWIFTQLTGVSVNFSLKRYTTGTFVVGITAMIALSILSLFVK
ncbi:MAG TPA: GntP family permease [Chryseolinea sp.]